MMARTALQNKTYLRWTFLCWINGALEETVGNSYKTRSELLDSVSGHDRLLSDAQTSRRVTTCNCPQVHHPIHVAFVLNRK